MITMDHKDLHLILDEILRVATLRHNANNPAPFAVMLCAEDKIVCLDGRNGSKSSESDGLRVIESGLSLMAHQGKCKAIGIALRLGIQLAGNTDIQAAVEHQDGSAYRVLLACVQDGPRHLV